MILSPFLIVTLVIVASMTAIATAVRYVSRIWLRHWVERQLSGAPTAELYLERPQRLILAATTIVAMTVFAAGLTMAASEMSIGARIPAILGYSLALLFFGQLLPRAVARRWPNVIIPPLLPFLRVAEFVLMPLLRFVRRLTGEGRLEQRRAQDTGAGDYLEELLREGEMEGVGEHTEIAIIEGVVHFGERTARDVMTPVGEAFALDVTLPSAELARRIAASGYSRVPLYRGTIDNIEGMVHAFDMVRIDDGERPLLRPVQAAAPTTPCKDLLFHMLRDRRHLAIVREGGSGPVIGIATLEDLMEVLVGDIRDEHDDPDAPSTRGNTAA
ncbi:MAG: CNNM domain-containing protein [Gemmatimonadota bacterium]